MKHIGRGSGRVGKGNTGQGRLDVIQYASKRYNKLPILESADLGKFNCSTVSSNRSKSL